MRHLVFLFLAVIAPMIDAHAASGVGINLNPPKYWSSDWQFIDEFKRAGGWITQCDRKQPQCRDFTAPASPGNTKEQARLELDENGWVKRLPPPDDTSVKFRSVSALMFQGNGGSQPPGRYVVLYDGQGTIDYSGGRKIAAESRPGRDVLEVGNRPGNALRLTIKRVVEGDHLRNIRVIGPGGVCTDAPRAYVRSASECRSSDAFRSLESLHATQTFHPAFLADLQGFRALRFLDWSAANTSRLASWRDRPRPTDALWTSPNGVPLEAMFELASAAGADPWINVPLHADDDYVREFAKLARRSVKAPNRLYVEYGNEPWNSAPPFGNAGMLHERNARALWPGATGEPWRIRLNWYALRAVQVCRIVKQEFGTQAERVQCVAGGQAGFAGVAETVLECPLAREQLGHRCSREFDALAIGPYFGGYLNGKHFAHVVDRWAEEPDGGLATLFRELTGRDADGQPVTPPLFAATGRSPRRGAMEHTRGGIVQNKKVADAHGLPLIAYEGGQHLVMRRPGKTHDMFKAAQRDPRMAAALSGHFDDWKAAGGELYVVFNYTDRGRLTFFGLKEHQLDEAAPKWQAVKAFRDQPCWWKGCTR